MNEVTDDVLVARSRAGDHAAFGLLMRRSNRRVYRVVRCVLREASDIEDAMQQAYVAAYLNIGRFAGLSSFATWVTRIALREAIASRARRDRERDVAGDAPLSGDSVMDPERDASSREHGRAIASAIESLPAHYRLVFVLREIEGLSTAEAAASLDVSEELVKVRLHRARGLLGDDLVRRLRTARAEILEFGGASCDALVRRTLITLGGRVSA
jgi:RNA polymerase sigma-70 factor (ECF subfamily)